jgi:phospholipase C
MGASAASAAMPPSIAKALAIPARQRTGTLRDVEHIVILVQENRSFDHLFGTLRGVRGFSDPRPVTLPSGKPVWHQRHGVQEWLPFRPPVADLGSTFLPDLPHGWNDTHKAWNGGWQDQFVPNKGLTSMTYHQRSDLPYHFALADAFTICDAYHCSLLGPTDPNRYHLWTGWVGNDGSGGGPVLDNAEAGYGWTSFPERLEQAGVSWKIYQDIGQGLDAEGKWGFCVDPFIGNYGDNSLLYLNQYRQAQPGSALAERAKQGTQILQQARDPLQLVAQFRDDVQQGRLPQVSWIVAPEAFSEHPNHPPAYGAWFTSQFLDALTSNPEVWSRTALFITYDEEGGFFDHMVPPTPAEDGSTVSVVHEIHPGGAQQIKGPYGLGMRVPMLVVSPWSRGGWVNSQVFDHTSLIRFIEARFAEQHPELRETNITPWRRAVAGDLTSAFDFRTPNAQPPKLPSTASSYPRVMTRQPDHALARPDGPTELPRQEPGVRPARALPYAMEVDGGLSADGQAFVIDMRNVGQATAVLQVRDLRGGSVPRSFTVEPGKSLSGRWEVDEEGQGAYDFEVHGPDGLFRAYRGVFGPAHAGLRLALRQEIRRQPALRLLLSASNRSGDAIGVRVRDAYAGREQRLTLPAAASVSLPFDGSATHGWFDLLVSLDGDARYASRLAGHLGHGGPSFSDPALGGQALNLQG